MSKIIAYASSTRPNHLWSAAQFNSALPKNRADADIPLVAQSELNVFKGKYRALLKLISKTRDKLVHVTDHIEDEGDRRYFGSTNDADDLIAIYHEMMSWIWDAVDETNRMKSDPYADIREQRARAEKAEAEIERLADKIEDLIAEFGDDPKAALQCVSEWLDLRRAVNGGTDA